MSLDLVYLILVNSLICIGFYKATYFDNHEVYEFDIKSNYQRQAQEQYTPHTIENKAIFWWVRYYGGWYLPDYIKKPLYQCPACMASIHSVLPFILYNAAAGWHWVLFLWFPFHVMAVAGLNSVISNKYL